jgi:hypothetical protein
MEERTSRGRAYDVAAGVVVFLGLYEGLVPLVARLLFDADQRFAPALWLPSPWWWIACLVIVVVALALIAVIDGAKGRRFAAEPEVKRRADFDGYQLASALVFLLGIYNGIAPFIARFVFGSDGPVLALSLRLPAPWWWITSLAVLVGTLVLLIVIEDLRRTSLRSRRDASRR